MAMAHVTSSDCRRLLPGMFTWNQTLENGKTWKGWVAFVCGGRSWKVHANGLSLAWDDRHIRRLVNFMLGRTEPDEWPRGWTSGDYIASFGEVRVKWRPDIGPRGMWCATFHSDHHHFGGQAENMLPAIERMLSVVDHHLRVRGR